MKVSNALKKLALAVTLTTCAAAQADTLRIASGVPPKHPGHNPLFTEFQKRLPQVSEGRLNAMILGPEIVVLPGMRDGIKSGLVDIGLFLPAYFPADLPEMNLVGDMAFLGKNSQAMTAAMTEYIVTCQECQAELKKLGVAYASSNASNLYNILSKTPIVTADDLKGKRFRVGAPQYSRWVSEMGGSPQSVPVGETFEALSQGVIDGTVTSVADIVSFRLNEAVGYVTQIDLGTYHSPISHAIRLDKWAEMKPEDRKAICITSYTTSALTTQRWDVLAAKGLEIANSSNMKILKADQSLIDATNAFIKKDIESAAATASERNNIANADQKLARFQTLISKWEEIAVKLDNDPIKMSEAVTEEVWSKVDFSTYGL